MAKKEKCLLDAQSIVLSDRFIEFCDDWDELDNIFCQDNNLHAKACDNTWDASDESISVAC